MTVNEIPDDVWLEIFDIDRLSEPDHCQWKWDRLAHVCRKWRQLIFASPLRLKLRILCKSGTPVRKNLGIWPPFPLIVHYDDYRRGIKIGDEDNVIAALEHPDRLYRVCLDAKKLSTRSLGKIIAMLQKPCPILTCLSIVAADNRNVLSAGFLGGSAPCLQRFRLYGIPFPALPTLLLSASNLSDLILKDIPPAGYTPPQKMVLYLATLPKLNTLRLGFQTVTTHSARILAQPIKRTVLPSLCELTFSGIFQYLEDLVAQIDTPLLNSLNIYYVDQGIEFEVLQLSQFLDRSEVLVKTLSDKCEITLSDDHVYLDIFGPGPWDSNEVGAISVGIGCEGTGQKVSQLTNLLSGITPIIPDMVHFSFEIDLAITDPYYMEESVNWYELFSQFPSVQTMLVGGSATGHISFALGDMMYLCRMDGVPDLLPALELICILNDDPPNCFHAFLSFRQDAGYPVTYIWDLEDFEKRKSCII